MYHFAMNDDQLERVDVETLPEDLENLYHDIRKKYTIVYSHSDWADDDRDAGMGYCYDNSYEVRREPARKELLVKDGEFVGFYVSYLDNFNFKQELKTGNILPLEHGASVYHRGTYSQFYGDSKCWELIIQEDPVAAEYVFLRRVNEENRERNFVPADFDAELVASIEKCYTIEDSYGHFADAFRLKLKLTAEGIANPDRVLEVLDAYNPCLVKE